MKWFGFVFGVILSVIGAVMLLRNLWIQYLQGWIKGWVRSWRPSRGRDVRYRRQRAEAVAFSTPPSREALADPQVQKDSPLMIQKPKATTPSVIVLYVMAHAERQFMGYELLQAIAAAELCYGEMDIFHRHTKKNGEGEVLFSVASATEPGTFDMQRMGAVQCLGLTLFMRVTHTLRDAQNFELMLNTAMQLRDDLDGILLDHTRQPLSKERIQMYRELLNAETEDTLLSVV